MKKDKITALYVRVSTDAQAEEGYSIDAQKEMLLGYCKSKQIENYEFFIDGGFSGSNIERPEMSRLIEKIKSKEIKSVVVYKLDRLSRSQKDTLFLIEDVLNPNQTEFVSLNENLDTSTSIGRAMLGIMSAFAQLERETIKERTRIGMKKRVEAGFWMGGGKVPFGFDYDKTSGKLIKNQDSNVVKKIYEMYIDGHSANYIASALGFKYDQQIIQIIKRKSNYGSIMYNGKEYENCHEGIIDKSLYLQAMTEMKRRSKQKVPTSKYLLTGLLECGECKAKLRYQKWGKYSTKIVCYSREKSKKYLIKDENCSLPIFDSEIIENYVLQEIFKIKTNSIKPNSEDKINVIKELKERKRQFENELKRLYSLFSKSDDDILIEAIEEAKERLQNIKKLIQSEEEKGVVSKEKKLIFDKLDNIKSIWKYISIHEQQQFIRSIIEKIVVSKTSIEIVYRL